MNFMKPRGFSLMEVLLATFILSIGLIMVASIFPVGANWTRQVVEDRTGQLIAENAVSIIKLRYPENNNYFNPNINDPTSQNTVLKGTTPFILQAIPSFTSVIPLNERAYQFGSNNPLPAQKPAECTYFWTALCRLNPIHNNNGNVKLSSSYNYDMFILVFRKGSHEQTFNGNPFTVGINTYNEVPGMRAVGEQNIPAVYFGSYNSGAVIISGIPQIENPYPNLGDSGIGINSGTVFKQGVNSGLTSAIARPALIVDEQIISSVPADGTQASPLIYVYQTTISF